MTTGKTIDLPASHRESCLRRIQDTVAIAKDFALDTSLWTLDAYQEDVCLYKLAQEPKKSSRQIHVRSTTTIHDGFDTVMAYLQAGTDRGTRACQAMLLGPRSSLETCVVSTLANTPDTFAAIKWQTLHVSDRSSKNVKLGTTFGTMYLDYVHVENPSSHHSNNELRTGKRVIETILMSGFQYAADNTDFRPFTIRHGVYLVNEVGPRQVEVTFAAKIDVLTDCMSCEIMQNLWHLMGLTVLNLKNQVEGRNTSVQSPQGSSARGSGGKAGKMSPKATALRNVSGKTRMDSLKKILSDLEE